MAALDIEPTNEAFYVAPGCLDALGGADKKLVEKGLSKFMEEAKRQKKRAERFQKNYSPPVSGGESICCFVLCGSVLVVFHNHECAHTRDGGGSGVCSSTCM